MSDKHIILTGPPGVGKTTLIKKIYSRLKENHKVVEGFYTEEIRTGRERIGFDIVTLSEQRGNLARVSVQNSSRPKVGKYSVDIQSFETLALPCFNCSVASILILDEIGKMELLSKIFLEEVKKAFSRTDIRILATIPVSRQSLPFVSELSTRKDCLLIAVSRENRNSLEKEIVDYLLEKR